MGSGWSEPPALAYYASLFISVIFESRRLGVDAVPDLDDDMAVEPQDFINLVMIIVPVTTVNDVISGTPKELVDAAVTRAMTDAQIVDPQVTFDRLAAVAATAGPGLIGGVIVLR